MAKEIYEIQDWKGRTVKKLECETPMEAIAEFKNLGYDSSATRDEVYQLLSQTPITKKVMSFLMENTEDINKHKVDVPFGSNRHLCSISEDRLLYNTHGLEQMIFKNAYDFARWHFDESADVRFQYSVRLGERNDDGGITWDDDIVNPWEVQMDPEEDGTVVWSKPMDAVITDDYNKLVDNARFKHFSLESIDGSELGTLKDKDAYYWQSGLKDGAVLAEFELYIPAEGKSFSVAVKNEGYCEVYVSLDEENSIIPYDENNSTRLVDEPEIYLKALEMEQGGGTQYLLTEDEPYLDISISQDGNYIGSWYDVFGSTYGSILECIESVTEKDVQQVIDSAKENNIFAKNFDDDEVEEPRSARP